MIQLLLSLFRIIGEYYDQIPIALSLDSERNRWHISHTIQLGSNGTYYAILQYLLTPLNIQKLPTPRKVYRQASMKTFASASKSKSIQSVQLESCVDTVLMNFPLYMQSIDVEVAGRSSRRLVM